MITRGDAALTVFGAFVLIALGMPPCTSRTGVKRPVAADPGVRGGPAGAGNPFSNLTADENTFFQEHINRNQQDLAAELARHITDEDRAAWTQGSIEDWVLEGHRLAQTVAYGDLGSQNPAVIGPDYEWQAEPAIETQLEKAGVRLAYLLNTALK